MEQATGVAFADELWEAAAFGAAVAEVIDRMVKLAKRRAETFIGFS